MATIAQLDMGGSFSSNYVIRNMEVCKGINLSLNRNSTPHLHSV